MMLLVACGQSPPPEGTLGEASRQTLDARTFTFEAEHRILWPAGAEVQFEVRGIVDAGTGGRRVTYTRRNPDLLIELQHDGAETLHWRARGPAQTDDWRRVRLPSTSGGVPVMGTADVPDFADPVEVIRLLQTGSLQLETLDPGTLEASEMTRVRTSVPMETQEGSILQTPVEAWVGADGFVRQVAFELVINETPRMVAFSQTRYSDFGSPLALALASPAPIVDGDGDGLSAAFYLLSYPLPEGALPGSEEVGSTEPANPKPDSGVYPTPFTPAAPRL